MARVTEYVGGRTQPRISVEYPLIIRIFGDAGQTVLFVYSCHECHG